MQRTILTIMFAALTMSATAQCADSTQVGQSAPKETCQSKNDTTNVNLVHPQFPGGKEELMKFLSMNIKYPEAAEHYGVEGRVIMRFVVGSDGSIRNISATDCKLERFNTTKFAQETEARQKELKEQFAKQFAKEGARVIRKMPKWTPGNVDGKPVNVKYSLPINFAIPNK